MTRETVERFMDAVTQGDLQTARDILQQHDYIVTPYTAFIVVTSPNGTRAVIAPYMRPQTVGMILRRLDPTLEIPPDTSGCHECPERTFSG